MIRTILLAAVLLASPVADKPVETGPNFNEPSRRDVPDDIPRNRCLMAIHGQSLRKERNAKIEFWDPPISDNTAAWLYIQRSQGRTIVRFCDEEPA